MTDHFVLLGDVVDSRSISNRDTFRRHLVRGCDRVNDQYEGDIFGELEILKGIDEIGCVLVSVTNLYDIAKELLNAIYPHQIRIAVVHGEIDVGVRTGSISQMDGPAFHQADELLNNIEQSGRLFDLRTGRMGFDLAVADQINHLLMMRQRWTNHQHDVVSKYEKIGTQNEVSEELGISQQAVSKVLRRASWPMIQHLEERLDRVLQEYDQID